MMCEEPQKPVQPWATDFWFLCSVLINPLCISIKWFVFHYCVRKCEKRFLFLVLWNALKTGVVLLFSILAPYRDYVSDFIMRICLRASLNNYSICEIHWHCVVMINAMRLKGLWHGMTLLDDWQAIWKWWICFKVKIIFISGWDFLSSFP